MVIKILKKIFKGGELKELIKKGDGLFKKGNYIEAKKELI